MNYLKLKMLKKCFKLCTYKGGTLNKWSTPKDDKEGTLVICYTPKGGNLSVWPYCYFFKNVRPRRVFGQNGIYITWNNDQKFQLVEQLMTGDYYENNTILLFSWIKKCFLFLVHNEGSIRNSATHFRMT